MLLLYYLVVNKFIIVVVVNLFFFSRTMKGFTNTIDVFFFLFAGRRFIRFNVESTKRTQKCTSCVY